MEAATMEAATMEAATMETATMETAKSAAMEAAASMKPTAPAMRASVGEARLTEYSSKQESGCGSSQSPSLFGLNLFFA